VVIPMTLLTFDLELVRKHGEAELVAQFRRLDPMLQAVFFYAAAYAYLRFGKPLLITSIERENAGVHSYHRGLDYDVDQYARYGGLLTSEALMLHDEIERVFIYDPARPTMRVCFFGTDDPAGKHWGHAHLQVCHSRRTRQRGGELYA